MAKNKAVFGIYRAQSGLENAVQMLRDERFSSSDVAVLLPESVSSRELGTQKASKAPEGATAGAGSGAVLGGILGWLVGIGSLAIPGVGPFIAAGPIVAALAVCCTGIRRQDASLRLRTPDLRAPLVEVFPADSRPGDALKAAVLTVDVRARVTGYLDNMPFKEGAEVKKGDVLFEIDPRPYEAQLEQARSQVSLNDASLKLAKRILERTGAEDIAYTSESSVKEGDRSRGASPGRY